MSGFKIPIQRIALGFIFACTAVTGVTSDASAAEEKYVQLSVLDNHTCGVLVSGSVKCWGWNFYGQLGFGYTSTAVSSPTLVPGLSDVQSVVVGSGSSCSVMRSGQAKCWGQNTYGQLGLGYTSTGYGAIKHSVLTPTLVPGLTDFKSIYSGAYHSCVLTYSGSVKCWGQNSYGQLGLGYTSTAVSSPTLVPGLTDVRSLVLGYYHSCAVLLSGQAKCWGENYRGQLGLGYTGEPVSSPTLVSALTDFKALSLGYSSCALLNSGSVKCWGWNLYGSLGLGNTTDVSLPTLVPGLSDVKSLVSAVTNSCALMNTGSVKCWGRNSEGQLGLGNTNSIVTSPSLVLGLSDVQSLVLGSSVSCAVLPSGLVKCWGENTYGQLGLGSTGSAVSSPTLIPGMVMQIGLKAPTSLATSSATATSICVTYVDPVNLTSDDRITSFEYSIDGGNIWLTNNVSGTASPLIISGLNRTTTYSIMIRAVNSQGRGDASEPVSFTTLAVPPSAPSINSVVAGNQEATVSFTNPTDSGGSSITSYQYSIDDGSTWTTASPSQSSGPMVIRNLTNGVGYSIRVRALNGAGSGSPSNSLLVTPQTTASAPTISSLIAGNNQATVDFTPPSDMGGAILLNYEYSTNGGATWIPASPAQTNSPLVIPGLTNGTTYSVKLRAVNSVGSGTASNAVSVKPIAPASAPTISGVTAGNAQATLTITAPGQINDSSLSGYDYSINNGSSWSHFASVTGPFTITGLTNATAYQVKVRAVNSAGASDSSDAVTVNPTKLIPAKPIIASVVGSDSSVTVRITTPAAATSQAITGYQYSIDRCATYQNAVVSNGVFVIAGLTNGVSVPVQVRANSFNGNSLASAAKTVVPTTTPASPSITTITPSAGALSIAFTAPNTGGSAITSYQYSLDGGSTWVVPAKAIKISPIKVTGLPNATAYQVTIRAVNAKGIGPSSDVVSASTPVLVPTAPSTTSIAKSSTALTVDVTAPVNNGGGAITNYAYSVDSGRTWIVVSPVSNSTRIVITGLKANTVYPVQIAAINSAGRGAASTKYNAITLR